MDAAAHRRNVADIAVGRQPALRSLLHFYLHLIGFTASTLLLTWGLFALFFVALGGFSLDGLMHQLNNLTARYVAASPDRIDRKSTRLNSSHYCASRMTSSA